MSFESQVTIQKALPLAASILQHLIESNVLSADLTAFQCLIILHATNRHHAASLLSHFIDIAVIHPTMTITHAISILQSRQHHIN